MTASIKEIAGAAGDAIDVLPLTELKLLQRRLQRRMDQLMAEQDPREAFLEDSKDLYIDGGRALTSDAHGGRHEYRADDKDDPRTAFIRWSATAWQRRGTT